MLTQAMKDYLDNREERPSSSALYEEGFRPPRDVLESTYTRQREFEVGRLGPVAFGKRVRKPFDRARNYWVAEHVAINPADNHRGHLYYEHDLVVAVLLDYIGWGAKLYPGCSICDITEVFSYLLGEERAYLATLPAVDLASVTPLRVARSA